MDDNKEFDENIIVEEKHDSKKKKKHEVEALKEEIKNLEEKVLRNQAELQNYKRRRDEELEKMLKYSNEDIIKELLPLLDNFERAIEMDDQDLTDEVSRFLEGFKMIYCSFANVFNQFDVKEIDALEKKFDPNYHQAILTDNISDMPDEMIIEVLQKGYILKDRVIRPSMVKVNINNEKEKENESNE